MDIEVRSDDLQRQATSVKNSAADISHTLQVVTGQIRDLATTWRGGSSDAFQSMWQEWQHGASQLLTAMDGIGTFLDQAAAAYEEAERQIMQAANH